MTSKAPCYGAQAFSPFYASIDADFAEDWLRGKELTAFLRVDRSEWFRSDLRLRTAAVRDGTARSADGIPAVIRAGLIAFKTTSHSHLHYHRRWQEIAVRWKTGLGPNPEDCVAHGKFGNAVTACWGGSGAQASWAAPRPASTKTRRAQTSQAPVNCSLSCHSRPAATGSVARGRTPWSSLLSSLGRSRAMSQFSQ